MDDPQGLGGQAGHGPAPRKLGHLRIMIHYAKVSTDIVDVTCAFAKWRSAA
jgi:hypothetical protein